MSQEFVNLNYITPSQPQELNKRVYLVKDGGYWNRVSTARPAIRSENVAKSRKRVADVVAPIPSPTKSFLLPATKQETNLINELECNSPPTLPINYVARPRLHEQLATDDCKLTQIIAPAGYGKSSLVVEWLQQNRRPNVWLSLQSSDNAHHQFWKRLMQTFNKLLPGVADSTLQMLNAPVLPTIQSTLPNLCKELWHAVEQRVAQQKWAKPAVIVIDNYQAIHNSVIHNRLCDLIHLMPAQIRVVILSRCELPFAETALHPFKTMTMRQVDLEFSALETVEFFKSTTARFASLDNALEISQRVEGWAAGMHLIASQLENAPKTLEELLFLKHGDPLISKLMCETFCAAHPTLQVFMLCTSLFSKFTPDLCDALFEGELGRMMFGEKINIGSKEGITFKNSQEMIDFLEKSGCFITHCEGAAKWWRYHPMFAEMLRVELRQRSYDLELTLRDRSQLWYLRQENKQNK